MLTYVLDINGQPLMPTERCGKVRRLLNAGLAKVIKRCPFTIQLLYQSGTETQDITLGVDAGAKHIGLSAVGSEKELYAGDVMLRTDVSDNITQRRTLRRARRNRKRRHREPRFDNRVHAKKRGWLAPSVEQRIQTHQSAIRRVCRILPISDIVVEVASFDDQKIKNPDISGAEYQEGDQLGFWNVREYVLFRDHHECQCCHGKSGDHVLEVHHKRQRKDGGSDAPSNLITLCHTCHTGYHRGIVKIPDAVLTKPRPYNDAAFMGIMRWTLYERLKAEYQSVHLTYGYITKNRRIEAGLPKDHFIDARCITGHPKVKPLGYVYYQRKVRCHNRQIHKLTISKGGTRKMNQAPKYVYGYQLFDKVWTPLGEGFIFGRRSSGGFDIRTLNGTRITPSISFRKIHLEEAKETLLTEVRLSPFLPTTEVVGFPA